jgi:hypothetical protein
MHLTFRWCWVVKSLLAADLTVRAFITRVLLWDRASQIRTVFYQMDRR